MGRRGCASAMGMIKFPSSCSSPKALCNQFIDYYICSRGVFCINHIKLRNFVVITIECSIATVDRGSIMTRIYRWSMMVYSSLQAEFMVTKYDGHIHRYDIMFNTLRPRQDGRHFPHDIFICILLNECEWHLIKISLKFVPYVPINNIPALIQLMAWRRAGDKPLSEPMMVSLLTPIYVTRPQWVK